MAHFSDFLRGKTKHFSDEEGALKWNILVAKWKHNVQNPTAHQLKCSPKIKITLNVTEEPRHLPGAKGEIRM